MASVVQTTGLVTALIYTRVSSDEQAREGLSLSTQLANCRRYAAERGWAIGEEYQDVLRGTEDHRPAYRELLADVRRLRAEGRGVAVVVMRLDRFGRKLLERVRSREELKRLGVPTHSVREGGEVSDIVANVLAAVAEEEVQRLGLRVSEVKEHLARGGWYPIGPAPWGYLIRPATEQEREQGSPRAVLDEDPERAPYVRELFRRVAAGESARSVSRWVSGLPPSVRRDRTLCNQGLLYILRSAVYAARQTKQRAAQHGDPDKKGKKRLYDARTPAEILASPVGRWPALVDDETWARVQARIRSHRQVPRQASQRYLLSGFLRCWRCGGRMAGSLSHGRGRYACGVGSRDGRPRCNGMLSRRVVEAAVLAEAIPLVDALGRSDPALGRAVKDAWGRLRRGHRSDAGQARALERSRGKASDRLLRATERFVDGEIDRQAYDLLRDKAQREMAAIDAELARLRATEPTPLLPPLEVVLRRAGGWAGVVAAGDVAGQRLILEELVERVLPRRTGFGKVAVELSWTPLGETLRSAAEQADIRAS